MKHPHLVCVASLIPSVALGSALSSTGPIDRLYFWSYIPSAVGVGTGYGFVNEVAEWDEQQCVTLSANLAVDMKTPTLGGSGTNTSGAGTIASGTIVDVHMIHFYTSSATPVTATIKFDGSIAGVDFTKASLDATDPFGPSTTYTSWAGRGIDTIAGDVFSVKGNTITFTLNPSGTNLLTAEIRVFTQREKLGDYNGDTFINGLDWASFILNYNSSDSWAADNNGDGFIEPIDYYLMSFALFPPQC